MSVQAGLTYLCSFNVCTFGAEFSTLFVEKEQKGYVIVVVAVASFLAGTRNLMFIGCRTLSFIVGICACIEIRSLVLARDDGVAGMCAKRVLQGKIQSVDLLVKRRRCLLGKMLRKVNRECSLGNSFCF